MQNLLAAEKLQQGDSDNVNAQDIVCLLINPTRLQPLCGKTSSSVLHMALLLLASGYRTQYK